MDKMRLIELVNRGNSTYDIAKEFGCSQTTVIYWLRKHCIVTKQSLIRQTDPVCLTCGELDPSKFKNAGKGRYCKSVCSSCHNDRMSEIYKDLKKRGIEYLGGKCKICGYDKCAGSLHFHHRDPSNKDPNWSKLRHHNWDRLKTELDKCDLLCANCHGEIHWGYNIMGM